MRIWTRSLGIALFFLAFPQAFAQNEFMSYTLDGRLLQMKETKLLRHSDNYLTIEGAVKEKVDFGEDAQPRYRDAEAGISFQISPEGDSFVGTFKGKSSDTLPVYVSWYEIGKEQGFVKIFAHSADMDSSQPEQIFTVTLENYGEEGTLIRGTFSGKLKGDDGKLHAVEEGKFAIRRKNVKD
ncbi:MAG: hypothetical protein JXA73_04870 [Acidobacteria bacterium]|nr:hypothetical protein [Acidobacteriota bacterium]